MKAAEFNHILQKQLQACQDVLGLKGEEYATEDRLHNFKVAAEMQGVSLRQALAGMMAKHTVSVYDMCSSVEYFSDAMWSEKITDHINYLILLRAVAREEAQEEVSIFDFEGTTSTSLRPTILNTTTRKDVSHD